jgi:hypothetical protein
MLDILGPVDESCKIAHLLQLLLQSVQGPNIYGVVLLVNNFDCDGRLSG